MRVQQDRRVSLPPVVARSTVRWRFLCRLALPLAGLSPGVAGALQTVVVTPDQPVVELGTALEFLEDPAGRLGIDDLLAGPQGDRFRANRSGREPSFGNTRSAYWFRFGLANRGPEDAELLLNIRYPLLDRVELHAPGKPVLILGDLLPFPERPVLTRHLAMPVTVPAATTSTFHLRVETSGIMTMPLEVGSPRRMLEVAHRRQLGLGLLYGIFAGALVYNLFLWLSARDAVNLYLVGHILSIGYGLACIDGLAFQLWPYWTNWQQWTPHLAAIMVAAFTLLFVRSLVDSRRRSPRLDRYLRLALWGLLLSCVFAAPFGARTLLRVAMSWLTVIGALLALTVAWHARRGQLQARIYACAWAVFLLLMASAAASSFNVIPHFFDFLIVARVAAAAEVLLAAIAVAANLREARAALTASETKFSRAFRSSPDALTLSTLENGRFIEVNDTFEQVSGYSRREALGRTSKELGLWPGDSRTSITEALRRDGSVRQKEAVIIHKSGRPVPVQFSAESIEIEGRPVLLATVRDITERKKAVRQREALIRELEAKNTELERFTYTASHDLRSPLVTILGFLGVLHKDVEGGDHRQFASDVGRIRAAAEHMRRLLDELLELSRIGRVVQPPERVPLTELAEEVAEMMRRTLAERGVEMVIAPDMPVVRADRTRLLQVFQNLLDNAVRFLGDQAEPRVEVGCRQQGQETVCYVRDNGIGIEPQHHEAVFELFRRLRPAVEGTGVGLSLVRRIIESHGGRIWVESEGAGTGSTFCFVIPEGDD